MLKKIIIVCIVFIIVAFTFYRIGRSEGECATNARLHAYLKDLHSIEQKLTTATADKTFVHNLQSGNYVLEIHSPQGVFTEELTITFTDNSCIFILTGNSSSKTSVPVQIVGNTINWSRDTGYSGDESYVGYIQTNCLIGNVYSGKNIGKWLIKKKAGE